MKGANRVHAAFLVLLVRMIYSHMLPVIIPHEVQLSESFFSAIRGHCDTGQQLQPLRRLNLLVAHSLSQPHWGIGNHRHT